MIQAITVQRLTNPELIQFCRDYITIVERNNPEELLVTKQLENFDGRVREMEIVFKSNTASALTAEIEELDHHRDRTYEGITHLIAGNRFHYKPAFAEAAETLYDYVSIYGAGVVRENYQSETAILNNFIEDLENKPALREAVHVLNLGGWVNELKSNNARFNEKYLSRTEESTEKPTYNIEEKRPEIIAAYRLLCKRLNAFAEINDSPIYEATITKLNAVIDKYIPLTLPRKKSKPKKADSTEEQTEL